jgi:hypothetical protein
MVFNFYKNKYRDWYIDLPEYPGPKEDLQMVAGADTLLDFLSGNTNSFTGIVSKTFIPEAIVISRDYQKPEPKEGEYYLYGELSIWLCPVTQFVFNEYPEKIYISKIS